MFVRVAAGILLSTAAGLGMGASVYRQDLPWLALLAWAPAVVGQHLVWPVRWSAVGPALAWVTYLAVAIVPALEPEIGLWAWAIPTGIGLLVLLLEKETVTKAVESRYRGFWWSNGFTSTAVEFGRSFIPSQATWSLVGYGLTAAYGWRQVSSWTGLFGLCLAVWLTNYAVAYLTLVLGRKAPWQTVPGGMAVFVALFAGLVTLLPAREAPQDRPTVRVAAFQVGFDLYGGLWNDRRISGDDLGLSQDLLEHGARWTRKAADAGARLVVWPEGFLRVVPQDHPVLKESLERLARETSAYLAVGYVTETPDGRRNEMAFVTPEGDWAVTAKDHPVPWAETGSVTQGQVSTVTIDGYRVGGIICYDADFTDTARERAAEGLHLLVAPAHDWPAIGRPRLVHLRARAAENRLPMILADWMVGSGAVDETGRILETMPTDRPTEGLLLVDMPVGSAVPAPYGRLGDLPGWFSLAMLPVVLLLEHRNRRATALRRAA